MIEQTLVLIKPDGVYRGLTGKIITTFEDAGLKVVALKMVRPDQDITGKHYVADNEWLISVGNKSINSYKEKGIKLKETATEIGNRVRNSLIEFLMSGPIIAIVLEGNEAIFTTRKLVGGTEPKKADPYSLRGRFSSDSYDLADVGKRPIRNIIHASEDGKTAEHEIALWFNKKEIQKYKRADEQVMY